MIRLTEDWLAVAKLWREAFGDSEEDVRFFLENAKHARCLALYEDEALAAMLFLVQCRLQGTEAQYIYAACTARDKRSHGCMSQLLSYARAHERCLCLIPATDSLVTYYADRGFTHHAPIDTLQFDENREIEEYLFEGYQLTEPMVLYNEREYYGI